MDCDDLQVNESQKFVCGKFGMLNEMQHSTDDEHSLFFRLYLVIDVIRRKSISTS